MLIKVTGIDIEEIGFEMWINPDCIFSVLDVGESSEIQFVDGQARTSMIVRESPTAIAQLVYEATHNQ